MRETGTAEAPLRVGQSSLMTKIHYFLDLQKQMLVNGLPGKTQIETNTGHRREP